MPFSVLWLTHSYQLAVFIHMDQRLNSKKCAHGSRGGADTTAVLQMVKDTVSSFAELLTLAAFGAGFAPQLMQKCRSGKLSKEEHIMID